VTLKLTVVPAQPDWSVGWAVTEGAVFTVKATRLDVAAGLQLPLTTQSKPFAAAAASADATLLTCKFVVVVPL
jgi:hypothetical protein